MTSLRKFLTLVLIGLFASCASTPATRSQGSSAGAPTIAFLHANVIPMDAERVLRDQTVVVTGGKVAAIGPAPAVKVPAAATRVDASGRYLIPALCDMHVHIEGVAWQMMQPAQARVAANEIRFDRLLLPYVAQGVTTVQVMSATPDEVPLRQRIERGEVIGPRLILAPMIDGPKKAWPPPISTWVATPEEAAAAVRQAHAIGYDKIKVYSFLSKESYDAIVSTARELNMDVIGHIPMALSLEYVLDAGQKLIAHSEEVAKHAHGHYEPERIDYYARTMVDHGVWMTPTLVTTSSILGLFDDSDAILHRPEAVYASDPIQQSVWTFVTQNLYLPIPDRARTKLRDDFEKLQRPLTKAFHDKGGKLMAGSDTVLPGLVPGFALHRELRELVAVGLTPYEALRTSTTTPYEYLGEAARRGTIAIGKESDMILVDANPLDDVSAASKVSGVLMRGRWIAKSEIDTRMAEIAAAGAPATASR